MPNPKWLNRNQIITEKETWEFGQTKEKKFQPDEQWEKALVYNVP